VSEELARTGRVARGYLGLGMQPVRLPEALRQRLGLQGDNGLIVVNVESDGPAATAGILLGDVLVALDGARLSSVDDVQAALARLRVGAGAVVSIVRAGAAAEVRLIVGERPRRK
jgi:S1-C subfamily serine protease